MCATASCNALYKAFTFDLYLRVSLKGIITCIWSFGYGFACSTAIECIVFEL